MCWSDLLFDGLRAFKKGSPNMNSLVGFGSIAAFIISAVRPFLKADIEFSLAFRDDPFLFFLVSFIIFNFFPFVGLTS